MDIAITIHKRKHINNYKKGTIKLITLDWTKLIGKAVKDSPKHPLDPCIQLMDECKRESDKQHLTHPSTAA